MDGSEAGARESLEELEKELWNLEELEEEAGEGGMEAQARVRGRVEHLKAARSGALLHGCLLCSSTSSNLYTEVGWGRHAATTAHRRMVGRFREVAMVRGTRGQLSSNTCCICGEKFASRKEIWEHLATNHTLLHGAPDNPSSSGALQSTLPVQPTPIRPTFTPTFSLKASGPPSPQYHSPPCPCLPLTPS